MINWFDLKNMLWTLNWKMWTRDRCGEDTRTLVNDNSIDRLESNVFLCFVKTNLFIFRPEICSKLFWYLKVKRNNWIIIIFEFEFWKLYLKFWNNFGVDRNSKMTKIHAYHKWTKNGCWWYFFEISFWIGCCVQNIK